MRAIAILLMAWSTGCGPTAYAKATSSVPQGENRWMISVRGKRLDAGHVMSYTHQRASELCFGKYAVLDSVASTSTGYYVNTYANTVTPVQNTSGSTLIECAK